MSTIIENTAESTTKSTNENTADMQELSFDELKNITLKVREEKKEKHIERIRLGKEDVIKHITEGCKQKMINAASNGLDRVDIYSFKWVKDPSQAYDEDGNKTVFDGNIRLLDLITKSKNDFIQSLNTFFNKDGEMKYHTGVYKKRYNEDGAYSWNIFVSWASKKPIFNKSLKDNSSTQNSQYFNKSKSFRKDKYSREERKELEKNIGDNLYQKKI